MNDQSVFINVPFDRGYERLFVALIASLISLGRRPRTVLEVSETGQGRLRRIQELLETCPVSIHDLSRVGTPVRFNMPFELGLAWSLNWHRAKRDEGSHEIIVLESKPHRLTKTLSDLRGIDQYTHNHRPTNLVNAILNALGTERNDPEPQTVQLLSKRLWKATCEIKQIARAEKIYSATVFRRVFSTGVGLAFRSGLISSQPA